MFRKYMAATTLIFAALICRAVIAQNAIVTFYSIPDQLSHELKESVSLFGKTSFRGYAFDGDQQLAHLSAGRFIAFELPAGHHVFSATLHKHHANGKYALAVELKPGERYFIRMTSKWKSAVVVPVVLYDHQLEFVTCPVAIQENAGSHSVEAKQVSSNARVSMVQGAAFQTCD